MWLDINGSGLNMSFTEVNELDVEDVTQLINMVRSQRKRERQAVRRA